MSCVSHKKTANTWFDVNFSVTEKFVASPFSLDAKSDNVSTSCEITLLYPWFFIKLLMYCAHSLETWHWELNTMQTSAALSSSSALTFLQLRCITWGFGNFISWNRFIRTAAKSSGFIWLHEVRFGGRGGLWRVIGNVEADAIVEFPFPLTSILDAAAAERTQCGKLSIFLPTLLFYVKSIMAEFRILSNVKFPKRQDSEPLKL